MYKLKLIISITFIAALAILMVAPIGSSDINNTFIIGFRLDYIIHCLIYLPWLFVCKIIFKDKFKPLQGLISGVTTSALLEFIQYILPYRSFNINDLMAGIIGVILSYFLFKLAQRLKCRNSIKH